jgi:small-conductance mechanosensitive channel
MNRDFTLLEDLKNAFIEVLPKALGVIAFIILAWLFLKIVLFFIKRFLKFSKLDVLNQKINNNEFLRSLNFEINLSIVILKIVKWILVLVIIVIGAELFELKMISNAVISFLGYLPALISAILILSFGLYLASYLKETVKNLLKSFDMSGSKSISSIVFYAVLFISFIIALNQLGVDTDIITRNLSIILGAGLLAFTIAMGLGSKDIILRLIFGFYTRKNIEIGKKIKIDDIVGVVISVDNICLVLQTDTSRIVYPIKTIVNKKIEILD